MTPADPLHPDAGDDDDARQLGGDAPPAAHAQASAPLDPDTAALLDRVNPTGGAADNGRPAPDDGVGASVLIVGGNGAAADAGPSQDFQAIVKQGALDAVRTHADANSAVEVCGVLVGRVYENAAAAIVYIDDVIRGDHATGRGTHVTFTADTWQHIDREMDAKHAGKRIVGWYHSHPGFGIFLSEMDLFIQRHFFNAPWQTALVYDPQSKERGLFAWRSGETARVEFAVDDGRGAATPEPNAAGSGVGAAGLPEHATGVSGMPPGSVADLMARLQHVEQRQRWILAACGLLALVAVVWPLLVLVVIAPTDRGSAAGAAPHPQPLTAPATTLPDLAGEADLPRLSDPLPTKRRAPAIAAPATAPAPGTAPAMPTTISPLPATTVPIPATTPTTSAPATRAQVLPAPTSQVAPASAPATAPR